MTTAETIRAIVDDWDLVEVGRKAIEDELIDWRDNRRFMVCGNGFSVCENDGTPSPIIRFRTDIGLKIALRAIAKHLEATS